MQSFDSSIFQQLYIPSPSSHKGQNGKLFIIGGSHLFHAASLWPLTLATRLVDMVFYSSVPENNEIVKKAKEEFRGGIVVIREQIEDYIKEAECILIGPGMVRSEKIQNAEYRIQNLAALNQIEDEGEQTYYLTKYLLEKYPEKKWVIDAGALQMMDPNWLKGLQQPAIVTPHAQEFLRLFNVEATPDTIAQNAFTYNTIILVKGEEDIVCSQQECIKITGGNAGMTKGGTGDVLAGLVASLACKNDMFLSALAGSYINKKAGEKLYETMGLYFNASDLVDAIPGVMKELIL